MLAHAQTRERLSQYPPVMITENQTNVFCLQSPVR